MSRLLPSTLLIVILFASGVQAQTPAFPGAEGFAKFAKGGRGGQVIEVTNLNASGPGSFREAVETPGPRIVVFRVGGIINLNTELLIKEGFLTIAGQTAPGDGIVIRGGLSIVAPEIIIRYVRIRPGVGCDADGSGPKVGDCDGLTINRGEPEYANGTENVIIDHSSISWAWDENTGGAWGGAYGGTHDITWQWNIISEGLKGCGSGCGSRGMLIGNGGTNVSIYHNIFAHNDQRNPVGQGGNIDMVNNLIYDFGSIPILFHSSSSVARTNIIGNYIKWGPISVAQGSNPAEIWFQHGAGGKDGKGGFAYLDDNLAELYPSGTVEGANILQRSSTQTIIESTPFNFGPVEISPATQVKSELIAGAGANRRLNPVGSMVDARDPVDTRIINDVINGTGSLITTENDVGGFPTYNNGTPPVDNDHDGMADTWEANHGFDPTNPADGSQDADGDGYTNVEEYLNASDPGSGSNSSLLPPTNLRIVSN